MIANHVLCQLEPYERPGFWANLRALLADGGVAISDVHFGHTETKTRPRSQVAEGRNGRCTVQKWMTVDPLDDAVRVTNEYEIHDEAGTCLHREVSVRVMELVHLDRCYAEIAEAGLAVESVDDHWMRLTHHGSGDRA